MFFRFGARGLEASRGFWEFPKVRGTSFGVLRIRILLFRVLYIRVPYFRKSPFESDVLPRFRTVYN